MKAVRFASFFAVSAMGAIPAMAAPSPGMVAKSESPVIQARADCAWVNNRWTYRKGDKVLVCRPDRPSGRGWVWHKEGNRFGWWNSGRREWHHKAW